MGFEGTVRHPASLNFRLFFGPFLHAVPLRLGLAEGAPWLAAPWPCLSCSCACCQRSLFRRFCTPCHCAWVQRGAPWLAGCALAALVLPAGLWLAFLLGFEAVRCRASLLLVFRNSPSPAPAQSPVRLRVRNCDPPKRKRALHNHPAVRAHMLASTTPWQR